MVLFFLIEAIVAAYNIEVSRFLVHFIGLYLVTYLTKKNVMGLFCYHNLFTFIIVAADVLISRFLINLYFDRSVQPLDAAPSMMIVIFAVASLSLITFEDIHKFENSKFGGEHKSLIGTVLVYKVYNFHKLYYVETNDFSEFVQLVILEFIINNAFFIIYNILNFWKVRENREKYIFFIIKRLAYMTVLRVIYRYLFLGQSITFNRIIDRVKSLFSNKQIEVLDKKTIYYNLFSYLAYLLLELI
jgi:hypothetical protein